MQRVGDWMLTYPNKIKFYPFDPQPEEIDIEDITWALSNICRFGGHVERFYSVAEHSFWVSLLCRSNPLAGLLHDAGEYVFGDVVSPVKHMRFMEIYRGAELFLRDMIWEKFSGGAVADWDEVKHWDEVMLQIEQRDLQGVQLEPRANLSVKEPMSPEEARGRFLMRFYSLTAKWDSGRPVLRPMAVPEGVRVG